MKSRKKIIIIIFFQQWGIHKYFRSIWSPKSGFHTVFYRIKRFPVAHTAQITQIRSEWGSQLVRVKRLRTFVSDSRGQFQSAEKRIRHRQIGSFKTASEIVNSICGTVLHEPIEHPHRILHIQVVLRDAGIPLVLFRLQNNGFSRCHNLLVKGIDAGGLLPCNIFFRPINFSHLENVPEWRPAILPSCPDNKPVGVEIRLGLFHRLVKGIQKRDRIPGSNSP